jgi:hypothetical protein
MLEMSDPIILSPSAADNKPKEMWTTPVRSVVRSMRQACKSYGEIRKETGLSALQFKGVKIYRQST